MLKKQYSARLLASVAVSALLGGTAYAQMPMSSPWQGPYVGVTAGGYGLSNQVTSPGGGLVPGDTGSLSSGGVMGGVEAGYNWQFSTVVLGLEADADIGSAHSTTTSFISGFSRTAGMPAFGTVRARLGYAFPTAPVLVYATGGLALGDMQDKVSISGLPNIKPDQTRIGWTAGAGAEYAFARNWTVKAEALYFDFGSSNATLNLPPTYRFSFRDNGAIGRVGVNFHF